VSKHVDKGIYAEKIDLALEEITDAGLGNSKHLGSALALNVDLFVSADARQCDAATQAGLRVVLV